MAIAIGRRTFDVCSDAPISRRDGAYFLAVDDLLNVPVAIASRGCFLVGGDIEEGESPADCLLREAAEKAGFILEDVQLVCEATIRFADLQAGVPVVASNLFFRAHVQQGAFLAAESDYDIAFLPFEQVSGRLELEHQRWAFECYREALRDVERTRGTVIDSLDFIEALSKSDVEMMRRIPKADLHNHIVFGAKRIDLEAIIGRAIANPDLPFRTFADMTAWCDQWVSAPSRSREGFLMRVAAGLAQARCDGVVVLHASVGACAIKWFDNVHEMLDTLGDLQKRYAPDIRVSWELCLDRGKSSAADLSSGLDMLRSGFFGSLDLVGDERLSSEPFVPLYREAGERGMLLKAHVGEFGDPASSKRVAELLCVSQIQHGSCFIQSPAYIDWLIHSGIQLNMCPSSNVGLSVVAEYNSHPITALYRSGVRVTVNTDDVTIFNNGVSEEFMVLAQKTTLTPGELNRIRLAALS